MIEIEKIMEISNELKEYADTDDDRYCDLIDMLDSECEKLSKNIDIDSELLDHLQSLNDKADYTGLCICRDSYTGRGWRLHETSHPMAVKDVRVAIKQHKESISSKHRKSEVEDN